MKKGEEEKARSSHRLPKPAQHLQGLMDGKDRSLSGLLLGGILVALHRNEGETGSWTSCAALVQALPMCCLQGPHMQVGQEDPQADGPLS